MKDFPAKDLHGVQATPDFAPGTISAGGRMTRQYFPNVKDSVAAVF